MHTFFLNRQLNLHQIRISMSNTPPDASNRRGLFSRLRETLLSYNIDFLALSVVVVSGIWGAAKIYTKMDSDMNDIKKELNDTREDLKEKHKIMQEKIEEINDKTEKQRDQALNFEHRISTLEVKVK